MIKKRIELVTLLPRESVAAEIGVAEGNFSRDLLAAGVGKLYSIDNWGHIPNATGDGNFPQEWHDENYRMAKEKLFPFRDRSVILRGISWRIPHYIKNESLDLLYLDGAHYYEGVKMDLDVYIDKVKRGGIVAGHDYLSPDYGVNQAVNEFCSKYGVSPIVIPEESPADAGFYFIKNW
jgi:hypothetical protein